jgi:sodium transport system permease protein
MGATFTVFVKEFLENLRDRRTVMSALLLGPLLGPIMFGTIVSRIVTQSVLDADVPLRLTLAGREHAPGLVDYLESKGVQLKFAPLTETAAREAVQNGTAQVVLIVPPEFRSRFAAALPAPVLLVADSTDSKTHTTAQRVTRLLSNYGSGIAQLRLQIRGLSPLLAVPVAVNDIDVATPRGRAVAILGAMTYFVLFALLMGGLYLAIDSTAGERERGSLEALLSLPVARGSLVGGKILATCAYMCLSLGISLTAFVLVFRLSSLERLGMSANLGIGTAAAFFAICLPFVPLGAALMTFVASFTRSYREAQTYLSCVLLVPTLPIIFASIYSLKPTTPLMFIPSLSQHLLMTSVLKGEPLLARDILASAGSSLVPALALLLLTARHWRRETMLG